MNQEGIQESMDAILPDGSAVEVAREYLAVTYRFPRETVDSLLVSGKNTMVMHLETADEAMRRRNPVALRQAVHGLKGSLLTLGLHDWADFIAQGGQNKNQENDVFVRMDPLLRQLKKGLSALLAL